MGFCSMRGLLCAARAGCAQIHLLRSIARAASQRRMEGENPARCYWTFSIFYGLFAVAIFLIPVIFINYKVTYQSILVAFPLFCAGVIVGLEPDERGRVRRKMRVAMITGAFVGIVLCGYGLINPFTILLSECPSHAHDWPHDAGDAWERERDEANRMLFASLKGAANLDATTRPSPLRLEVVVRYDELVTAGAAAPGEAEEIRLTQHILLLKYNVTHREIVRRELAPARSAASKRSWVQTEVEHVRLRAEPVCSTHATSHFHFLASEIADALGERRAAARTRRSVVHVRAHHDPGGGGGFGADGDWDEEEEERTELTLWTRIICRRELGFLVVYIVFIFLEVLLMLLTIVWYTFYVKDVEELATVR